MKVFEILHDNATQVTEENLTARLRGFDWKYEFSDDTRRQARGHQAMNILESMVYQLWKKNSNKAVELWNSYAPGGRHGVTPSFIHRMESQDNRKA